MKRYFIFIRYNIRADHWIVLIKGPSFETPTVLMTQTRLRGDSTGLRSMSLLRKRLSLFGLL